LSASPDLAGQGMQAVWDALMDLPKPDVEKYTTLTMFFGVWEVERGTS